MVKGQLQLRARFNRVPNIVKRELEKQIEKEAEKLVGQLRAIAPRGKTGNMAESIGWTWGEVPKGSLKIGQAFGKGYGKLSATIYVGAFYSRFVEFGTVKMPSSPFFFPVFRASKQNIRSNLSRAVTRAMKKA